MLIPVHCLVSGIVLLILNKFTWSLVFSFLVFRNLAGLASICVQGEVELVDVEVPFMSILAIYDLGLIGLLGLYCPSSRKKKRSLSGKQDYMHLGAFKKYQEFHYCNWFQPFLTAKDQSYLLQKASEDNIAAACLSSSSIFRV